jgi:hypothetical protein
MPAKRETVWMNAARGAIREFTEHFEEMDRGLLEKGGIYREKISLYKKRANLPNGVPLIACLILCKFPLKVSDPETGRTWVLHFEEEEVQLNLPL